MVIYLGWDLQLETWSYVHSLKINQIANYCIFISETEIAGDALAVIMDS